jgi:hypothetical protein
MKFSGLAVLALLSISSVGYGDTVTLSNVNNHLNNAYGLGANQSASESFTLNQTTDVSSITTGIAPEDFGMFLGFNWQVVISGQGTTLAFAPGTANWTGSLILPGGGYTVGFFGGACPIPPTPGCEVAGIDYYIPTIGQINLVYTQIGGTMSGPFGFTLEGDTVSPVPEPASVAMVGSGLLAALFSMRRRSLNA